MDGWVGGGGTYIYTLYIHTCVHKKLEMGEFSGAKGHTGGITVGGQFRNDALEEGGCVGVALVRGVDEGLGVGGCEGLFEAFFADVPVEDGEGDACFGGAKLGDVLCVCFFFFIIYCVCFCE
jgi:hypothetical protein